MVSCGKKSVIKNIKGIITSNSSNQYNVKVEKFKVNRH